MSHTELVESGFEDADRAGEYLEAATDAFDNQLFGDTDARGVDRFITYLRDHGDVDPKATDKPLYWTAFANYARAKYRQGDTIAELGQGVAALCALTADTPRLLLQQPALDRLNREAKIRDLRPEEYQARRALKMAASQYNGWIRTVIEHTPGLRASDLEEHLLKVAVFATAKHQPAEVSRAKIHETIRGMQHEHVAGKMLEHAGAHIEPTTREQDLRGADYIYIAEDGLRVAIDIKASLSEVEVRNNGANGLPFHVDLRNDKIVVFSLLSDQDLDDGFSLTDTASAKAEKLRAYVEAGVAIIRGKFNGIASPQAYPLRNVG